MSIIVSAPRAHWQVVELELEEIDQPWRIVKAPPMPRSQAVEKKCATGASPGLGGLLGGKSTFGQIGGAVMSELAKRRTEGAQQPPPPKQAKMPPPPPRLTVARSRPAPLPAPARAKVVMEPSRAEISTARLSATLSRSAPRW